MTKNNCLNQEKIQEYLDKNLPTNEMKEVAAHVSACSICRQELDAFSKLYEAAGNSARRELSVGIPLQSVDEVLLKIRQCKEPPPKDPSQIVATRWKEILSGFRWLLVPAFSLVLLALFLRNNRHVETQAIQEPSQFSLLQNSVELVLGDPADHLKLAQLESRLGDVKRLPGNVGIELPENAMIMVQVGNHRLKFSSAANFVLTEKEVALTKGSASFDFSGDHQGFRATTPFVSITPLGTGFDLEVKDWGVKVVLRSGKIKLTTKSGKQKILKGKDVIFVARDGRMSKNIPQPKTDSSNQLPLGNENLPKSEPSSNDSGSPAKLLDAF